MQIDPTARSLTFDSVEELAAFHDELGILVREVTIAASSSSKDPEVATARAREVLERFTTVTALLNSVRSSGLLQRNPG
ncbi:MAG: hypothetical protein JRH11_01430 [Deltaproteobacteria bacterium]|nr:hypothetical protein [Deltaproteobacteria bacterium]